MSKTIGNCNDDIGKMAERILAAIKKVVQDDAKVDRTFKAAITEKIHDAKYRVLYCGNTYTVSSSIPCNIGDYVWVCAPCNNWDSLFVVCKTK